MPALPKMLKNLKKIGNMKAIFDTILDHVPVRDDDPDGPFAAADFSLITSKLRWQDRYRPHQKRQNQTSPGSCHYERS